jgi:hypothetical protein
MFDWLVSVSIVSFESAIGSSKSKYQSLALIPLVGSCTP